MTIETQIQSEVGIATVSGEITHAVAGDLQTRLASLMAETRGLAIDMGGVTMLTSAGLRTLLLLHRQAGGSGKILVLACVPETVRDVMDVTGFLAQFRVCASLAEAVATIA